MEEKPDKKKTTSTLEASLIASEIRYRRLFETAKDGILILDAETGEIQDVNPFLTELLGFTKAEFMGKEIWQIGFLRDLVANRQKFYELQQKEYVRYENLPLKTSSGQAINVEFVSNVYLVHNKKVIQCNIRDITARKKDEAALQQVNGELQHLLNNLEEAVFSVDVVHNKVLQASLAHQSIYGYAPEVFLKNPDFLKEITIREDKQKIEAGFAILASGKNLQQEFRILHSDGKIRWIEIKINPTADSSGKLIRIDGIATNITQRKQVEQELILSKEHAEESDQLKTAFLQNISHEIRTPLNGIIGFSNLLNSADISKEDISKYTTIINKSGKRLIEIVNNVLDISKIQKKQIKIVKTPVILDTLLADLLSIFYPAAQIKNLELRYNNHHPSRIINTDAGKLNQILTNLINNAIKFTTSGKIDFGYEVEDHFLRFYVRDSGIGIPIALHSKIFERFIQAEISTSKNYEGAGLGLAICKGLVEILGGSIWVESKENEGATFYFTIPYVKKGIFLHPSPDKLLQPLIRPHGKILVAEDDPNSSAYLSVLLTNAEITVLQAANGLEAVEMVKDTPDIDLVFMDIRMPKMDGFDATKQIKKIRPGLPIIAQTAYAFSEEKKKILASGFDDYLTKPIDVDIINGLVKKYLK